MSDVSNNENEKTSDTFNVLSFERKLVGLVEELRVRRNLESESEKTLEALMDRKHNEELSWDEQKRILQRETDSLEQQIGLLKRKLEDKACTSDDKAEASCFQKRIQELEGKLSLHTKFQESIVNQISDIRKSMKSLIQESQELATDQKNLLENVAKVKYSFRKYEICTKHLQESLAIVHQKNDTLKKELISCRSELSLLKNTFPTEVKKPSNNNLELVKLERKILELEQLLLLSRKENEKTLCNFLESNKLLCHFMEKYSEMQEREKTSAINFESSTKEMVETRRKLQEAIDEITLTKEEAEKEKQRKGTMYSSETQTEENLSKCPTCFHSIHEVTLNVAACLDESPKSSTDFVENLRNDLMELQKNAVIRQSEMYSTTDYKSSPANSFYDAKMDGIAISRHPIAAVSSSMKSLEFTEILKRKIDVMNSGEERESVFIKRILLEINEDDTDKKKSEEVYGESPLSITMERSGNLKKSVNGYLNNGYPR